VHDIVHVEFVTHISETALNRAVPPVRDLCVSLQASISDTAYHTVTVCNTAATKKVNTAHSTKPASIKRDL